MYCSVAYACIEEEAAVQLHLLFIVVHAMHVCPDVHLIFLGSGATTSFGTAPGFASLGVCLDHEILGEEVTSDTVAYCSTFRLFVVNIVLP